MPTTQLPEPERISRLVDELLATIIDWQIDLAIPDSELDEHLGMYGRSGDCLLYTSPSPRDRTRSRMPSSA